MNIVYDAGLELNDEYRVALYPLLPAGNSPLELDSFDGKIKGTPNPNEGFVFLTRLDRGEVNYHSSFFGMYKNAPQWFFILLSESDHGVTLLRNAAIRYDLKNAAPFHAGSIEAFEAVVNEIANTKFYKRKALLFSKHEKAWVSDLARILFDDESKYEIMYPAIFKESDSDTLLLCGEKILDFKNLICPGNREPHFVFGFNGELQRLINCDKLVSELAEYYSKTTEWVEDRLYFVDVESEKWLAKTEKSLGDDAVRDGILIWDRFGLPVSHAEYTEDNIKKVANISRESIEKLKKTI